MRNICDIQKLVMTTKPKISQHIQNDHIKSLFKDIVFVLLFLLLFHPNINIYGRLIECLKETTGNQMREKGRERKPKTHQLNMDCYIFLFVSNARVILSFFVLFFCCCFDNQHSHCVHTRLFIVYTFSKLFICCNMLNKK